RVVPPHPPRPFAPVLARGRSALPRLAGRTRVFPHRGPPAQGLAARPAGRLRSAAALCDGDGGGRRPSTAAQDPSMRVLLLLGVAALCATACSKSPGERLAETALSAA